MGMGKNIRKLGGSKTRYHGLEKSGLTGTTQAVKLSNVQLVRQTASIAPKPLPPGGGLAGEAKAGLGWIFFSFVEVLISRLRKTKSPRVELFFQRFLSKKRSSRIKTCHPVWEHFKLLKVNLGKDAALKYSNLRLTV